MVIEDKEFANLDLKSQVKIICGYLSLPTLEGNDLAVQRINQYIEAYHAVQSEYASAGHNDSELENKIKVLMIPMEAAKSIMNDGEVHPVIDMLIASEKVGSQSFDKDFALVRKPKGSIPKLIEDDDPYLKINGFALLGKLLILTAILTVALTLFYYYLQNR